VRRRTTTDDDGRRRPSSSAVAQLCRQVDVRRRAVRERAFSSLDFSVKFSITVDFVLSHRQI